MGVSKLKKDIDFNVCSCSSHIFITEQYISLGKRPKTRRRMEGWERKRVCYCLLWICWYRLHWFIWTRIHRRRWMWYAILFLLFNLLSYAKTQCLINGVMCMSCLSHGESLVTEKNTMEVRSLKTRLPQEWDTTNVVRYHVKRHAVAPFTNWQRSKSWTRFL